MDLLSRIDIALPLSAYSNVLGNPKHKYWDDIYKGAELAANLKVCFCGLARNIGKAVDNTIQHIDKAGKHFDSYNVCIFENDSTDDTKQKLTEWSNANDNVFVHCTNVGKKHWGPVRDLARMVDLAAYRNACRDMVLQTSDDYDLVIVLDTDLAGWSVNGLFNTIGQFANWDFSGSVSWAMVNNKWVHYDAWACRVDNWRPAHHKEINPWLPLPGGDLLPVKSCFGGLGVYKMAAYKSAEYAGTDCEHVCLHRKMVDNGFTKLVINPAQVTLY